MRNDWRELCRWHGVLLAVVAALVAGAASPALAIPSFAQQTGQPCAACHVGAFGPQLKPFGRDFKLYGYQSADGKSHVPPIALMVQTSVTHTKVDQDPVPAPHFGANDNFAVDQISVFYGGRAPMGFGAFGQLTYSGASRSFNLDNVDIRRAWSVQILGKDSVVGLDFNNNPTVQDVWNSTPAWGFPYNGSSLAPTPAAATLVDGGLAGIVAGSGLYALWNDTLYVEAAAYAPIERRFAGRLGEGTDGQSDRWSGMTPYGRVALLHDFGGAPKATVELGAYAIRARRYPGGEVSQGLDTFTDVAVDGNFQYFGWGPHVLSAHATYIQERQDLPASSALSGTRLSDRLATARADLSYSWSDTFTPSVQLFKTTGTRDPALYSVGPANAGYVLELAWSPYGKPKSALQWLNARFALQYVGYTEFDGDRRHASQNDTLYANMWVAMAPLGWMVHR